MTSALIQEVKSNTFEVDSLNCYEEALLIRLTEQRLLDLFKEGKLSGTVHTCIGQEFIGIAVSKQLVAGDTVFSNHRCHGHFLARTANLEGLLAELLGKAQGVSGGRGGSQHLCQDGFYSNGIQGGIVPVSAGLAFAHQLNGKKNIAVVFIGDGTLGEGVIYEAFNLASKWNLPLLIVLEDNGYSQSTAQQQTLAGTIQDRAQAFGIQYNSANTWDVAKLMTVAQASADYVRHQSKPLLLHIKTYRLTAHSKGDDDRDPNEIRKYNALDPLYLFESEYPILFADATLKIKQLLADTIHQIETQVLPTQTMDSNDSFYPLLLSKIHWKQQTLDSDERMNSLIYEALLKGMEKNERILLLGEDIEHPYGGAFKVTKDLSSRFPHRVKNMPISEAAIIGLGNGLALQGYLPVCEIMFGDFLLLAADQIINHAAKFKYMYNEQVRVPLIIRTPMGGRRGYGPTHSQSVEN